jgi:hypothetical protein
MNDHSDKMCCAEQKFPKRKLTTRLGTEGKGICRKRQRGLRESVGSFTSSSPRIEMIRPRLTDYYGIPAVQKELSFAVPFLDEDLPLYVDPFLLWKSPSQQDNSLHVAIVDSINALGRMWLEGGRKEAIDAIIRASECGEVGLGQSRTREGKPLGKHESEQILQLFERIPQIHDHGLGRLEVLQLTSTGVGKDRISDFTCSFIKSFLIDYTIDQCDKLKIPRQKGCAVQVFSLKTKRFDNETDLTLPVNPETGKPILLVPKRWLRFIPWINFDDYFAQYVPQDDTLKGVEKLGHVEVLDFNRQHYDAVERYIEARVRSAADCKNDPLFSQIPISSAKAKLDELQKLRTGISEKADKRYEDLLVTMLSSFLYPDCDFATDQARTDSGVSIRDLIFYNNRSHEFLRDIFDTYDSRQLVFELKNVKAIEREHINQLNRYIAGSFGRFGVLVTRNALPRAMFKNTVDLWSGQRKAIISLTDQDIEQMVDVFESKQRPPLDVVKKKYFEFEKALPK